MFKALANVLISVIFTGIAYGAQSTVPPVPDIAQNVSYVVVIDPAHGGSDLGVNIHGAMEKDITLKAAKMIKEKLEKKASGITVFLTRNSDSFVTAMDRAGFANSKKAALFISIHCDYSVNPLTEGYKVYYSSGNNIPAKKDDTDVTEWTKVKFYHVDESMRLAAAISQYMQSPLIPETGAAGNSAVDSTVAGKYRKEKSVSLISIEGADMPAVVIELGNLNNSNDLSYLKDEKALNTMAYHIKEAVCNFLKDEK